MNIIAFQKELEKILNSPTKEQLQVIIHALTNLVPDEKRIEFLDCIQPKSSQNVALDMEQAEVLLQALSEQGVHLKEIFNEDYDDERDDYDDQYDYLQYDDSVEKLELLNTYLKQFLKDEETTRKAYSLIEQILQIKLYIFKEYDETEVLSFSDECEFYLEELYQELKVNLLLIAIQSSTQVEQCAQHFISLVEEIGMIISYDSLLSEVQYQSDYAKLTHALIKEIPNYPSNDKTEYLLKQLLPLCNESSVLVETGLHCLKEYPQIIAYYLEHDADSAFIETYKDYLMEQVPLDNLLHGTIAKQIADVTGEHKYYLEVLRSLPDFKNYLSLWEHNPSKEELDAAYKIIEKAYAKSDENPYSSDICDRKDYLLIRFMHGEYFDVLNQNMDEREQRFILALLLLVLHQDVNVQEEACQMMIRKLEQQRGYRNVDFRLPISIYKKQLHLNQQTKNKLMIEAENGVHRFVSKIMGWQKRNEYWDAVLYIKALADTKRSLSIKGEPEQTIQQYRDEYKRYSAFQRLFDSEDE